MFPAFGDAWHRRCFTRGMIASTSSTAASDGTPKGWAASFCRSLAAALLLCPGIAAAVTPLADSPRAHESLALCEEADRASAAERLGLLARGLELAEAAVTADGGDAAAHFALFCNLGRRMRLAGVGLKSLSDLRRLR